MMLPRAQEILGSTPSALQRTRVGNIFCGKHQFDQQGIAKLTNRLVVTSLFIQRVVSIVGLMQEPFKLKILGSNPRRPTTLQREKHAKCTIKLKNSRLTMEELIILLLFLEGMVK